MFHDFEIYSLELRDKVLTMRISIPWCEMWEIDEYILTFKFFECDKFNCIYDVRKSTELVHWKEGVYYPTEEKETSDTVLIEKMKLDIQNHDFLEPNTFKLNCNSSTSFGNEIGQIDFGQISFNANNYQIFDPEGLKVELTQMKSWANDWWKAIEKMMNENKETKQENKIIKPLDTWSIMNMRYQVRNTVILGFGFTILYAIIVVYSIGLDNWVESLIQLSGLTVALFINHNLKTNSIKFQFWTDVIIALIYGTLTNYILWSLYPSSELNTVSEFLMFHLNNNYIIIFGILLSLSLIIIRKSIHRQ